MVSTDPPTRCDCVGASWSWPCGCGRQHVVYVHDAANTDHGWHWAGQHWRTDCLLGQVAADWPASTILDLQRSERDIVDSQTVDSEKREVSAGVVQSRIPTRDGRHIVHNVSVRLAPPASVDVNGIRTLINVDVDVGADGRVIGLSAAWIDDTEDPLLTG
jgi:hypothetical protein